MEEALEISHDLYPRRNVQHTTNEGWRLNRDIGEALERQVRCEALSETFSDLNRFCSIAAGNTGMLQDVDYRLRECHANGLLIFLAPHLCEGRHLTAISAVLRAIVSALWAV